MGSFLFLGTAELRCVCGERSAWSNIDGGVPMGVLLRSQSPRRNKHRHTCGIARRQNQASFARPARFHKRRSIRIWRLDHLLWCSTLHSSPAFAKYTTNTNLVTFASADFIKQNKRKEAEPVGDGILVDPPLRCQSLQGNGSSTKGQDREGKNDWRIGEVSERKLVVSVRCGKERHMTRG